MKSVFSFLFAASLTIAHGTSGDRLSEENLSVLHRLLQPEAEELIWKDSIPWRTDLWEARREAAALGKPIFLWEMDGHPLGCT